MTYPLRRLAGLGRRSRRNANHKDHCRQHPTEARTPSWSVHVSHLVSCFVTPRAPSSRAYQHAGAPSIVSGGIGVLPTKIAHNCRVYGFCMFADYPTPVTVRRVITLLRVTV